MKRLLLLITILAAVVNIGCSNFDADGNSINPFSTLTDAKSVAADTDSLKVSLGGLDTDINNITTSLPLTTLGENGSTITWSSSNIAVIANDGTVVRPAFASGNAAVTLTATITKGGKTETKTFTVTVLKIPPTDAEAVTADRASLVSATILGANVDLTHITGNLTLPTTGSSGTTISWQSFDPALANDGTVTCPSYSSGDTFSFMLRATITKGSSSQMTTFFVKVLKAPLSALEAIDLDKTALVNDSIRGSNADLSNVTANLASPLPSTGSNGTTITWVSDNHTYMADNGTITPPAYGSGSATITLTATISKGTDSDTKPFTIVILPTLPTPAQSVSADMASLIEASIKGANSDLNNVISDLTLPSTGANGTTITWSSNNTSAISNAGVAVRPFSSDAAGSLTATITKSGTTDTKVFPYTVKTWSGDYFVSATGSDSNAGTKAAPFATISQAITTAAATGAVKNIYVSAGTYSVTETITITDKISLYGGFNNGFTARDVSTAGRTNATYQTKISSTAVYILKSVDSTTYTAPLIIDGFFIEMGSASKYGVWSHANQTNTFIRNITITANASPGVYDVYAVWVYNTTNYEISNCIVDLSTVTVNNATTLNLHGITVTKAAGTIKNNMVKGPACSGFSKYTDGMWISQPVDSSTTIVSGNTIDFSSAINSSSGVICGLILNVLNGSGQMVYVDKNTISINNAGNALPKISGIQASICNLSITNNTVIVKGAATDWLGGITAFDNCNNTVIYNNSVYVSGTCSDKYYGIRVASPLTKVKNNAIYFTGPWTNMYGIFNGGTITDNVSYNFIYTTGTDNQTSSFYAYNATNFLGTDPVFNTADDLKLQAGSPVNVKTGGTNLYSSSSYMQTDKAGIARPSSGEWSIGAYLP